MHIVVDDAKLDVTTAGAGDAIVLLHGFPFAHEIWNAQIERLAQRHFVVAPDLRGLGKSSVTDGPYLMESLAGDLAGILDALGVRSATIVGHSLGGYVALAFFRMFSERVDRLALVCSRIDADSAAAANARLATADQAERDGVRALIEKHGPSLFAPQTPDAVRAPVMELMKRTDARGYAAMLRGMAHRVSSEDLVEEMRMPLLVVTGAQDPLVGADHWRDVLRAVPGARSAVCERSAHLPMVEEPARLSDILSDFAGDAQP